MLLKNNELPLNKDLSSCNVDIPTTFSLIIKGFIFQFRFKTKESQLRKINFIFFNESLIISDTPWNKSGRVKKKISLKNRYNVIKLINKKNRNMNRILVETFMKRAKWKEDLPEIVMTSKL